MSDTVAVTYAGLPIVAAHASSSMSTTGRGQVPAVSPRNSSGVSYGPDEEDGTDVAQCGVERFCRGEVAGDDLDVRWQLRRLGATRQGATLTGGLMALMMTLCPSCQRGAGGLGVRATVNPGARVPPGAGDAP
jgi:hypothetical protein